MVDLRQSPAYAKYIQSLGWIVEEGVFIKKLGIFGAIAKIQRTNLPPHWRGIVQKHRVWMTKVEPATEGQVPVLKTHGFRQDHWPLLATKTLSISLTPPKENIYAQFKKDCRYILRKLTNDQCSVASNDFEGFYKVWQESSKRKSLWMPSFSQYQKLIKVFGKNVFCITINNQAGALVLIYDQVAYYYYAGATQEGTKANLPYLVVWECVKEAKKRGCKTWDFEGIYDGRFPNKAWQGFSHFKKSFGGLEVAFPGSFTRWL